MIEQHHTFSHVHAMNKAGLNILNHISHSVRSYWRCAGFALLPARPGLSAIAGPGVSRKRTSGLCLVPLEYLQHASGLFTSTNCSSKSPERRMVIMDTLCSHYFTRNTHTHALCIVQTYANISPWCFESQIFTLSQALSLIALVLSLASTRSCCMPEIASSGPIAHFASTL